MNTIDQSYTQILSNDQLIDIELGKIRAALERIEELKKGRFTTPTPFPPFYQPAPGYMPMPMVPAPRCGKCDMEWSGVMGYVCGRGDCPNNAISCTSAK